MKRITSKRHSVRNQLLDMYHEAVHDPDRLEREMQDIFAQVVEPQAIEHRSKHKFVSIAFEQTDNEPVGKSPFEPMQKQPEMLFSWNKHGVWCHWPPRVVWE